MSNKAKIARRTFLRGIGASLALPYLEIMTRSGRAALAGSSSTAAPPVRFMSIVQPNGVYPAAWDVTGTGRDFALSPILEPLRALKDDLIVVSNLDNIGASGHVQMTSAFLSGVPVKNQVGGLSLDQMVARKIGGDTLLPSIELGTEPPRQGGVNGEPIAIASTCSWSSPTTQMMPEINPRVAFDRLFRNQTSPEARREAAGRKSVVDLVLGDAKALRRQASARDQHKLDEYLESVRSVEVQIDRALNPPERSWMPPTRPHLVPPPTASRPGATNT